MKTIKILITLLMFTFITNVTAQQTYQEPNILGKGFILKDIKGNNITHTITNQLVDNFTELGLKYFVLKEKDKKLDLDNICTINFIGENIITENYIENEVNKKRILTIKAIYWTDLEYLIIKCVTLESMYNKDGKITYIVFDLNSKYTSILRDVCPNIIETNDECYSWITS